MSTQATFACYGKDWAPTIDWIDELHGTFLCNGETEGELIPRQVGPATGSRSVEQSLEKKLASQASADRIWLTRPEVAHYLGVQKRILDSYSSTRYPDLRYSKVGGRAMYKLSDVMAFLENRQKGRAAE